MLLHGAILPTISPPQLLRLPTRRSPSCSGVPHGLCSFALHLRIERQRNCGAGAVRCSTSQVHSHGTVDYELKSPSKWVSLYRRLSIMENADASSAAVLEQWENEERELSKWDFCRVIKEFRKFRRFKRALEVYDWMKSHSERFAFNSGDYAIQLDLIAKVRGISHAEEYFSSLPAALKDKRTYGALLNAYCHAKSREKAEATLDLMKSKGYAIDVLPFNVMMTLCMNLGDHSQVFAMIDEMKENNVAFDLYSYNIWMTNCAAVGDAAEMERVFQEMIADASIRADWTAYSTLATMYIRLGEFNKARNCLNDVELILTGKDRIPFNYLLGLYGTIGERDEVYRIWNRYKSVFRGILNTGYQSMLSSLVKLGDGEGAEEIYKEWLSNASKLDPRVCNNFMRYYLRDGRVSDAEKVLDRFVERGGKPRPLSWEILGEGYLKEGRVLEVMSCMEAAASCKGRGSWRPRSSDVAKVIELCRERDEKECVRSLIDVLRRTGCLEREEYKSLIAK